MPLLLYPQLLRRTPLAKERSQLEGSGLMFFRHLGQRALLAECYLCWHCHSRTHWFLVVTVPLLLNLEVSSVLLFFSVYRHNSYGWFFLNWEKFQRPDYSNKQKATNCHFYRWQHTNTANNDIFMEYWPWQSPPNTAAVSYQVPSGTAGARGFSQADGHEVLCWLD